MAKNILQLEVFFGPLLISQKMVNIKALNAVSTTENFIHFRLFPFTENIHCLNYIILFLWIVFYHVKTAFWKLSLNSRNLWALLGIYLRKILQIHIKVKMQVSCLYYKWENSPNLKISSSHVWKYFLCLLFYHLWEKR